MPAIAPKIRGRAFFPGGWGRAREHSPPLPARPIMIVGQDFGTIGYYASVESPNEPLDVTWPTLLAVLDKAQINPDNCFFTNVLMGARRTGPITGIHPALDDLQFVRDCLSLFDTQIAAMRPSVIVGLGLVPIGLITSHLKLSMLPRPRWTASGRNSKWKDVDDACLQFIESVSREGKDHGRFAFASVLHPANRKPNLKLRSWPAVKLAGAEADDAIWAHVANQFRSANPS